MRPNDIFAIPAPPRHKVIHHIFFVLGSGYEWHKSGQIESLDDWDGSVSWRVIPDKEIEDHIELCVRRYPTLFSEEDSNFCDLYPCESWGLVQYDGIPDNASVKCLELIAEHCGLILASTTRKTWVAATNKVLLRVRTLRRKIETPSKYKIYR